MLKQMAGRAANAFGIYGKLPELPEPVPPIPKDGTAVLTWQSLRMYRNGQSDSGWSIAYYTNEWFGYSYGRCVRLFRMMTPYTGRSIMLLCKNGTIFAYQDVDVVRQNTSGMAHGGRWSKETVRVSRTLLKRAGWLKLLGINWIRA